MTITSLKTGRPLELQDLSNPLPLPRVICVFHEAFKDRYCPMNAPAKLLRNWLAKGLYVSKKDLAMAENFVTIEIF